MFKINTYLHTNQIDLTLSISGVPNWNLPMENVGFRIFKGSKNTLEVIVRNNDRKPINLSNSQLVFTISDPDNQTVILQRLLPIQNPLSGSATLVLDYFDTDEWPLGFLRYNVMMQASDGSQSVLYVDQHEGFSGYFELSDGPDLGPVVSQQCTNFTPGALSSPYINYYYSNIFIGNAQPYKHSAGSITIAAYTTNWTGTMFIQGCVEESVPVTYEQWFPILINENTSISLNAFTGITPVTFEASLSWVRVVYLPDVLNHGTFDQVFLRA